MDTNTRFPRTFAEIEGLQALLKGFAEQDVANNTYDVNLSIIRERVDGISSIFNIEGQSSSCNCAPEKI